MNASVRQDSLTDWPDTSDDIVPSDNPYRAATWLLGRHRQLAELAARCPGVVEYDPDDGELGVELPLLAEGMRIHDDWVLARALYTKRHPAPAADAAYDRWEAASPQFPDTAAGAVAKEIAHTSGSEKTRLRLLATFAWAGARISMGDFGRLDTNGQRLLADWLNAAETA